ncbi:alpha-amylase family protein [Paraglaciecola sp. L3A3]|uniref:alpha-amylase family protein n=1 Tax=Paraglaciecola sp. L3A3 TaxID=2686358 RepID=UPI00131D9B74|nr:alpha-amylase family protein [Paraglaciecola sp. L3A3]
MFAKNLITTALLAVFAAGCAPTSKTTSMVSPQNESTNSIPLSERGFIVDSPLEQTAVAKLAKLESLMLQAKNKSLDVTREETTVWFAYEFLKYAEWDEANKAETQKFFANYQPFKDKQEQYATGLPDFERQKVIEILDHSISTLTKVMKGEINRRAVAKVDWNNVDVADDMFVNSDGKPVFLYDYFSKSMGNPTSDTRLYNDHLGNVDHLPSINPYLINQDGTINKYQLKALSSYPDTSIGFALFWNSNLPDWIKTQEPEVEKGRSLFTGFDIDNPLMKDAWGNIIREVTEHSKGKNTIKLGYILSNEPHWFSEKGHWTQNFHEMTSISSYTQAKFRDWLNIQYQSDIKALNTNWHTQFSNFNEVTIEIPIAPALQGTPIWYDWCRFNMARSLEWFTFLQNEIHEVDPEADTHIKIMPDLFTENYRSHGIDLEALTELTTMIGDDAKTRGRDLRHKTPEEWEAHYAYFWEELAVSYDFMESVSPNKIHVNSETHFLSTSWWRDLDLSPAYVRNSFWLATLMGMDAGLTWFWARDPDGSPEDRLEGKLKFFDPAMAGSYAASTGMQPQVANELTQVMMDLNSYSEEIMALRKQKRPVRLFHSETSAINKNNHMSEQFELYESLFFEGFPLGYATQKIINQQDNNLWDVVVVYKTEFVTDAEFNALQSYLNNGGTVVIDSPLSLSKNEYGVPRQQQLISAKGKLITMANVDIVSLKQQVLDIVRPKQADVLLTERNGSNHKGCTWRVVKQANGRYLMTIINIGKNTAQLSTSMKNGQKALATNMLTGEALANTFELASNGVLLLDIAAE